MQLWCLLWWYFLSCGESSITSHLGYELHVSTILSCLKSDKITPTWHSVKVKDPEHFQVMCRLRLLCLTQSAGHNKQEGSTLLIQGHAVQGIELGIRFQTPTYSDIPQSCRPTLLTKLCSDHEEQGVQLTGSEWQWSVVHPWLPESHSKGTQLGDEGS